MSRAIALGVALGLTGLVAYSLTDRFLLPIVLPVDIGTLEVSPVNFADMNANETRDFCLHLSNRSLRTLVLLPPRTNCGCIRLDEGEVIVPRKSSTDIRFQLRTGNAPGKIAKTITLVARDFPGLQWEVRVEGNVVARIWAEPPGLNLEPEEHLLTTTILIHRTQDVDIGRVLASSPAVTATTKTLGDDLIEVGLQINCLRDGKMSNGAAVVQVLSREGGQELLRIPLEWKPRRSLRCVPEVVMIDRGQALAGSIEKSIVLLTRSKGKEALKIETLVPWVHVEKTERRPFGFMVRVKLETARMPSTFDKPILKFSAKPDAAPVLLSARF